jgi:glycosyltransferase involved in cell wall biosynthesis
MSEPICILGMHRAGTSLTSRIVNLMGIPIGPNEKMLAPAGDNPTGFWEHDEIRVINEKILEELGGTWDEIPVFPAHWEKSSRLDEVRAEALEIIKRDFPSQGMWAWKDPRNSLTLPFWKDLVAPCKYVLCVRNPVDVFKSLQVRNQFPVEKAMSLWMAYIASALLNTSGQERLVIFYEDTMDDWRAETDRLAAFLLDGDTPQDNSTIDSIGSFLDHAMIHHKSAPTDVVRSPLVPDAVKYMYSALRLMRDASMGGHEGRSSPKLYDELMLDYFAQRTWERDQEAQAYRKSLEAQEVARRQLQSELRAKELEFDRAHADLATLEETLDSEQHAGFRKDAQIVELGAQIESLGKQVDTLDHELEVARQVNVDQGQLISKLKGEEAAVASQVSALRASARKLRAVVTEQEQHIVGMEHSLSWRLTRPIRQAKQWLGSGLRRQTDRRLVIIPVPSMYVTPVVGQFNTWQSEGNDPQMDLRPTGGRVLPSGWTRWSFELEYSQGLRPNPTLYVDSGHGFRESETIHLPPPILGVVSALVHLPRQVNALRFDPLDEPGQFEIGFIHCTQLTFVEGILASLFGFSPASPRQEQTISDLASKSLLVIKRDGFMPFSRKVWKRIQAGIGRATSAGTVRPPSASMRLYVTRSLERFDNNPRISVLVPTYNTDPTWLRATVASVQAQSYELWELCLCDDGSSESRTLEAIREVAKSDERIKVRFLEKNAGISAATNAASELATGEYLAFLDHDDELTSNALYEVVRVINANPSAKVIYSDQDKIGLDGEVQEVFYKPDWSPGMLMGVMYVGHLLVMKRDFYELLGGLRSEFDKVQDFELMLRVSELTDQIEHIPLVLYRWRAVPGSVASGHDEKSGIEALQVAAVNEHLKRMGITASARSHPLHRHRVVIEPAERQSYPIVSIVIPTRDAPTLISACLRSIRALTTYPSYEIVVVDNDTSDKTALDVIREHADTVVPFPIQFNFSKANNLGVEHTKGEIIVFLNNDIEVITGAWIEHLLLHLEMPGVVATGPLLVYSDKTVQHAGVVLGLRGTADHIMRGYPADVDGYAGSLSCPREVSAVTAACMMIRKADFLAEGGFNEYFATHYQDVDLCLRLRESGGLIRYVPTAKLLHHESVTRGSYYDLMDRAALLDAWGRTIEVGDPYYNPNFILSMPGYTTKP